MLTYNHTGIPVDTKLDNMIFIEPLKVWITDAGAHPHKVELLYFEPDSRMPAAVQCETHIAYLSDNIEADLAGKNVIWPVTAVGNLKVAFIYDADTTVEICQVC